MRRSVTCPGQQAFCGCEQASVSWPVRSRRLVSQELINAGQCDDEWRGGEVPSWSRAALNRVASCSAGPVPQ